MTNPAAQIELPLAAIAQASGCPAVLDGFICYPVAEGMPKLAGPVRLIAGGAASLIWATPAEAIAFGHSRVGSAVELSAAAIRVRVAHGRVVGILALEEAA